VGAAACRARRYRRRGADACRVTLTEELLVGEPADVDIVALSAALDEFARIDQRKSRVVELRYFGGLSVEETAEALGISPETVARDWRLARAWLRRELGERWIRYPVCCRPDQNQIVRGLSQRQMLRNDDQTGAALQPREFDEMSRHRCLIVRDQNTVLACGDGENIQIVQAGQARTSRF
jgi:ECF sigma factor